MESGTPPSLSTPTPAWSWVIILSVLLLVGCGGGSYAPVSDRTLSSGTTASVSAPVSTSSVAKLSSSSSKYYRVRKGDTLYAIAFRYGKDFKALARANGITSHYRIYPGQVIRLQEAPAKNTQMARKKTKSVVKSTKARVSEKASATSQSTSSSSKSVALASRKLSWKWPAQGRVVQGFSATGSINKGIDIGANKGDPVFAAEGGQVVYAGSGLLGYGNLIIINHNQYFLSAYAHNSLVFVKEHDTVRQGEKIAEVGHSGAAKNMLHFEIRKNGKPVNPLRYLPRKK